MRLRAKPNFRSPGQALRQAHPGGGGGRGRLAADQLRELGAGRTADAGARGRAGELSCRRTWWSSARSPATGWCGSDGPFVVGARSRRSPSAPPRGRGAGDGQPDPAAPEGSGIRVYRPDRALDRGSGRGGSRPCGRTPTSFRARRWPGASSIGARAPAPDLEQQVDIDGHEVVVGVQRHPDGRNGAGPQPRNGE